jgi:hypothetical protein
MTGVTVKLLGSEAGSHSRTPFVLSLLIGELLERETKPESWLLGGENTGKWGERKGEKDPLKVAALSAFHRYMMRFQQREKHLPFLFWVASVLFVFVFQQILIKISSASLELKRKTFYTVHLLNWKRKEGEF